MTCIFIINRKCETINIKSIMKQLFYLLILTFLFTSCIKNKHNMISENRKKEIKDEIKKEIDSLIIGCESLDMSLAFKVFSKSPDFFMIASDGNFYDYQTFYNNNKNYFEICSSFELDTKKLDIKVLSDDLVIVSWLYKVVATLKTGNKDIIENAGATFLFKKIDNKWIVINYQESSLPPEQRS